jgi:hypothetical protein
VEPRKVKLTDVDSRMVDAIGWGDGEWMGRGPMLVKEYKVSVTEGNRF